MGDDKSAESICLLEEQQSHVARKNHRATMAPGVAPLPPSKEEELVNAALFGNLELIAQLLASGASPNVPGASGYTPLFWSVLNHNGPVADRLLKAGADPNARDSLGWTPLCHAVSLSDEPLIQILLDAGADVLVRLPGNQDIVKLAKSKRIYRLLCDTRKAQKQRHKLLSTSSMQILPSLSFEGVPEDVVLRHQGLTQSKEDLRRLEDEIAVAEAKRTAEEKELATKRARILRLQNDLKMRQKAIQVREEAIRSPNLPADPQVPVRAGAVGAGAALEEIALSSAVEKIALADVTLGNQLGSGGFATVYRAFWHGDAVAVKLMKAQSADYAAVEEFKKEALFLTKMRHPNVVLIIGVCIEPPQLAIVTEILGRGDLFGHIHAPPERRLNWRLKTQIAFDIARGMNYLHTMRPPLVHRDLKSSNILIDERWRAKVSDFGTSRFREETAIQTIHALGTPGWMAPECLRGEQFDEKSDVYSYGVVLWELLEGLIPWDGKDPVQVIGAVGFRGERLPLRSSYPGVPPFVLQLVALCFLPASERPSFSDILVIFSKFFSSQNNQP